MYAGVTSSFILMALEVHSSEIMVKDARNILQGVYMLAGESLVYSSLLCTVLVFEA